MKKIINYILIAVFIFTGVIGPVFLGMVEAQGVILEPAPMDTGDESLDTPATDGTTTEDNTTNGDSSGGGATQKTEVDSAGTTTNNKDVPSLTVPNKYDELLECDIWDGQISDCFVWGAYGITYVSAEILRLSGIVFDSILIFSLDKTTINQDFVEIVWKKLKDIAYSLFIILMVIIGISTIVGLKQFGSKEKVVTILAVAVAINFSLFAARVVVDTGNILGLSFYDAISTYKTTTFGHVEVKNLSGSLVSTFNPSEMFSVTMFQSWKKEFQRGDKTTTLIPNMALILIYLTAAAMMLYVAFVFLSVFFMLIARLLWIWVVMMTAPLAFLGLAIPQLKGQYSKWWKKLIDNAFSFVAFMFFIWLFMIIQKSDFFKGSDLLNATGASDWLKIVMVALMKFAIMVTLLNHAKGMMKSMSGDGGIGDMALGFAKTMAVGAATGGLGLAARGTLGRFATKGAERMVAEGKVTGTYNKLRLQALRGISGAKFGTKDSFVEQRDNVAKKHGTYMEGFKDVKDEAGKVIKSKTDLQKEYIDKIRGTAIKAPTFQKDATTGKWSFGTKEVGRVPIVASMMGRGAGTTKAATDFDAKLKAGETKKKKKIELEEKRAELSKAERDTRTKRNLVEATEKEIASNQEKRNMMAEEIKNEQDTAIRNAKQKQLDALDAEISKGQEIVRKTNDEIKIQVEKNVDLRDKIEKLRKDTGEKKESKDKDKKDKE